MAGAVEVPCEWAKPVEGELWEVVESLDEARLAISTCLREQNPPDEELKLFLRRFDHARDGLQKLLLDVLSPEGGPTGAEPGT